MHRCAAGVGVPKIDKTFVGLPAPEISLVFPVVQEAVRQDDPALYRRRASGVGQRGRTTIRDIRAEGMHPSNGLQALHLACHNRTMPRRQWSVLFPMLRVRNAAGHTARHGPSGAWASLKSDDIFPSFCRRPILWTTLPLYVTFVTARCITSSNPRLRHARPRLVRGSTNFQKFVGT